MSTTNLFVELLVIGIGAGIWVFLIVLSVLGTHWLTPEMFQSYTGLGVCLALVYVLGVITDRVADFVFDKFFSTSIRCQYFAEKRSYQDARRLVLRESNRLADLHEYGRIRIRVARGWAINAILIAISLQVFVHSQYPDESWTNRASGLGACGLITLAVGCWWSWSMLCSTEYLKIREHAEFLRNHETVTPGQFRKSA